MLEKVLTRVQGQLQGTTRAISGINEKVFESETSFADKCGNSLVQGTGVKSKMEIIGPPGVQKLRLEHCGVDRPLVEGDFVGAVDFSRAKVVGLFLGHGVGDEVGRGRDGFVASAPDQELLRVVAACSIRSCETSRSDLVHNIPSQVDMLDLDD